MNKQRIQEQLQKLSLSFFRKDFFGIYHGSISAKTDNSRFLINTNDAVFDSIDSQSLIELYYQKDYRWNQASIDAHIHLAIYKTMSDAKFISFSMPPYTSAYALKHNIIAPKDYFGFKEIGNITIYDPKNFDDWYERASSEISKYFQTNQTHVMIIRGYGVYAFNRDIAEMAKELAIIEKSCRLLLQEDKTQDDYEF
jgi:L-fuculose-phosphate aldolase